MDSKTVWDHLNKRIQEHENLKAYYLRMHASEERAVTALTDLRNELFPPDEQPVPPTA